MYACPFIYLYEIIITGFYFNELVFLFFPISLFFLSVLAGLLIYSTRAVGRENETGSEPRVSGSFLQFHGKWSCGKGWGVRASWLCVCVCVCCLALEICKIHQMCFYFFFLFVCSKRGVIGVFKEVLTYIM
ncbi:hypothetical protein DFH27DRAFT_148448 [Peziza echinospora]|nr:hypothetical protein DFH27DRAFT_148448 [Peziza echinospora]